MPLSRSIHLKSYFLQSNAAFLLAVFVLKGSGILWSLNTDQIIAHSKLILCNFLTGWYLASEVKATSNVNLWNCLWSECIEPRWPLFPADGFSNLEKFEKMSEFYTKDDIVLHLNYSGIKELTDRDFYTERFRKAQYLYLKRNLVKTLVRV